MAEMKDTSEGSAGEQPLQFERAEFPASRARGQCSTCAQSIVFRYFELAGKMICEPCRDEVSARQRFSWAAFGRAALYGSGAALVAAIGWNLITRLTGYQIGLVGIAVGMFVGEAVARGAGRRTAFAFRYLAMMLTYGAIVSSYAPAVLRELSRPPAHSNADEQPAAMKAAVAPSPSSQGVSAPAQSLTAEQWIDAIAYLLLIIAIAPFLGGFSNIMGILILIFGVLEAIRRNSPLRLQLKGPFELATNPIAAREGT